MGEKYSSQLLRVVIAQIAQTIGYNYTQSAPLELLEDILERFIQELARDLHSQAEHANRFDPNIKDAFLSLQNLNINMYELLDYMANVEAIPFVREVPVYPVKRQCHLNFLKPGSAETLTRPIHIFEYLPPMLPMDPITGSAKCRNQSDHQHVGLYGSVMESNREAALNFTHGPSVNVLQDVKGDYRSASSDLTKWCIKNDLLTRDIQDPDGHQIREIRSVVMTTGGFISPAIEGKLPKPFIPNIIEKFKGFDAPPLSPSQPQTDFQNTLSLLPTNLETDISAGKLSPLKLTTWDEKRDQGTSKFNYPNEASESRNLLAPSLPKKKTKKKYLLDGDQLGRDPCINRVKEKAQRKALKLFQKLSKGHLESGLKKSNKNFNREKLLALSESSTERMQLENLIKKNKKQKHLKNQKPQQKLQTDPNLSIIPSTMGSALNSMNVALAPPLFTTGSEVSRLPENMESAQKSLEKEETSLYAKRNIYNNAIKDILTTDEIKRACEQDQNKLNIFKKISKKKGPIALSPNTLNNNATNVFINSNNGSSLISLPYGTTITPAPMLYSNTTENSKRFMNASQSLNTPISNIPTYVSESESLKGSVAPNANLSNIGINKPKKRGRKPGGKNPSRTQIDISSFTTTASAASYSPQNVNSVKSNEALAYTSKLTNSNDISTQSVTLPLLEPLSIEPLNLCHDKYLQNNSSNINFNSALIGVRDTTNKEVFKLIKSKEKKEKKKSKAKYNNIDTDNKLQVSSEQIGFLNTTNQMLSSGFPPAKPLSNESVECNIEHPSPNCGIKQYISTSFPKVDVHGYVATSSGGSSSLSNLPSTIYPTNQAKLMPILPLLQFAPRPGLIPSGPTLFPPTGLTNFGAKVSCNSNANVIMPHTYLPFSGAGPSTTIVKSSPITFESTDNSGTEMLGPLQSVSQLDRRYCNVAPLVPESLKLTSEKIDGTKHVIKSGDLHMTDSNFSHLSKLCGNNHNLGTSKFMPVLKSSPISTGNLGDPIEVSDDSNDVESNKNKNQEINDSIHTHDFKSTVIHNVQHQRLKFTESQNLHSLNPKSFNLSIIDSKQVKQLVNSAAIKVNQNHADTIPLATVTNASCNTSSFNIDFVGSDKFSLAGGADLIPLALEDSGLAYSAQMVPATSLAAGATSASLSNPTPSLKSTDDQDLGRANSLSMNDLKHCKVHKKIRKPKDGKLKKKKDKKDKTKKKDKLDEKNMLKVEKHIQDKKSKKYKKKEKASPDQPISKENLDSSMLQTRNVAVSYDACSYRDTVAEDLSTTVPPKAIIQTSQSPKLDISPNQVPKIMLKLSGQSTPIPFEKDLESTHLGTVRLTPSRNKREHSPELARFSPLVTGPPKPKQCETPTLSISIASSISVSNNITQAIPISMLNPHAAAPNLVPSAWSSNTSPASATLSASSVLLPQQLLQTSQHLSKISSTSLSTLFDNASVLPIKAENVQALQQNTEFSRPSSYVDAEGHRIWICPACGKVDDGSAMIGCDGCDAWYHWICVGIFVAPNDNDDWYCRVCISKKKVHGLEKKRKRSKKK